jgi:hypothetical protein
VEEDCRFIGRLVKTGRDAGVPKWAVWETVSAAITGGRLQSHGAHVFDLSHGGAVAGKHVLEDAKYSDHLAGYYDKADTKAGKAREAKKNPDALPATLVLSRGHGLYFHLGIDPSASPKIHARGVTPPRRLAERVDGSGSPLPFVKLSGDHTDLNAVGRIKPKALAAIRKRREEALRGIDMDKAKQHVAKQIKAANDRGRKILAEDDPEATIRAGMKAAGYSDEQIEQVLKTKPAKKSKGEAG